MAHITIYSDYVCPFCYLAEQILEEVRRELPQLNITVHWKAFELRPYPTPTLRPEDEYLPRIWEQAVYPMARQLGVTIRLPSISPQPHTHLAFEGFQYAREQGKGEAYTLRMFEAFFKEDEDIGDIDILTRLAGGLGLDGAAYRQALEERRYREAHQQELESSYRLGIRAVPTFQIGGDLYQGVLPKEQLKKIIRASVTA
ncbi:DsbA family oxidoreductase [Cesiribacter andamanensis]|uniref:Protein-disulfide isomerase n=1 Tax=Cesiribacter andamanensis AMV16 TaxID=1279009 RepID=M7N454_9BACT|nr:DsbA family oxidoreductase [Cesiribacter andamanensis]EMR03453.1 Protein-disulfide isomerase [Cesiribacter andamanensis AMV16]